MVGPNERRLSLEDLQDRNARWDFYREERIRKGRPPYRMTYCQWDCGTKRIRPASVVEDPILDLHVARLNRNFCTRSADRYAEIRARVMAPAKLPSKHYDDPLYREAMRDMERASATVTQLMAPMKSLLGQIFGKAA